MAAEKFIPIGITLDQNQQNILSEIEKILQQRLVKTSLFDLFKQKSEVNGIYIQGSVGSGKTMIMHACYKMINGKKQLIHYQDFIQQIHKNIHQFENQARVNILQKIAKNYAQEFDYIFLDEFEIKDITDAMIIKTLFQELVKNKVFIVLTTNSLPENLYRDGLQRELFLPCIELIKKEFSLLKLDSTRDYRMEASNVNSEKIFYPINTQNQHKIEKIIYNLTKNKLSPCSLEVFGRKIIFNNSNFDTLITDDEELFGRDLSYIDYIQICQNFKIITIKEMKVIESANNNLITRFINFIDNAYFYKVILYINLATSVDRIYENLAGKPEFQRTISRLHEMNSNLYARTLNEQ